MVDKITQSWCKFITPVKLNGLCTITSMVRAKIFIKRNDSMKEIESDKHAWGQISQDHYVHFKKVLLEGKHQLNKHIQNDFGDLSGKKIIHLQCNTGADTILLAKMGVSAVGVDLVPDNILYAQKLAEDLNVSKGMELQRKEVGKCNQL